MIKPIIRCCIPVLAVLLLYACQKKDTVAETAYLRKYWNETASSNYEVPISRTTAITAHMFLNLMTDNVFYYDILVDTTLGTDVLSGAGLYYGTAASKGDLMTDLKPVINGRHISGNITLTSQQAEAMMSQPMFLNVQSKTFSNGLLRLQLEKNIDWYQDVPLDGGSVVPAVTTAATGKVVLRMTTDKVLHYQVIINNVPATDALKETHLHTGAAGTNGTLTYTFATTAADYNAVKSITGLADATISTLKTAACYIDVHSATYTAGLLRGQLR
ncbi:MAG: CHRD domain-containing protein [Chitinophagaceae bacterium]